ncbi:unnamed protein product [Nippostrongylus brasiliensis]|uniref:Uncharacterized protein n=1 Tax=Nippostrongylus brasiliensis TaxID=27835 RepID=A0A0N4YJQ8_NIPBR|nr:unnamed protein product [Nippostrongylus brasiliensis]
MYEHVLMANDDTLCKIGLVLDVPGTRPRRRPQQRWLDAIHADLKTVGVHPDQAYDRSLWHQRICRAGPLRSGTDAKEEEEGLTLAFVTVGFVHKLNDYCETRMLRMELKEVVLGPTRPVISDHPSI